MRCRALTWDSTRPIWRCIGDEDQGLGSGPTVGLQVPDETVAGRAAFVDEEVDRRACVKFVEGHLPPIPRDDCEVRDGGTDLETGIRRERIRSQNPLGALKNWQHSSEQSQDDHEVPRDVIAAARIAIVAAALMGLPDLGVYLNE